MSLPNICKYLRNLHSDAKTQNSVHLYFQSKDRFPMKLQMFLDIGYWTLPVAMPTMSRYIYSRMVDICLHVKDYIGVMTRGKLEGWDYGRGEGKPRAYRTVSCNNKINQFLKRNLVIPKNKQKCHY